MSKNDFLLLIDSNQYLELYRQDKVKKILSMLEEQSSHIFVTQHIVDEVKRNRVKIAVRFFLQKSNELKKNSFKLPDVLSESKEDQRDRILNNLADIFNNLKNVSDDIDSLFVHLIGQISSSCDEISKVLEPIFSKAILHSDEELQRARLRKDMRNPPGKKEDPIGDELIWEQILTNFKNKKKLWIITEDQDYGSIYKKERFLNNFLYDELYKISHKAEVYWFDSLTKGIDHFVANTGVKALNRFTPEEKEEIEKEEENLLPSKLLVEDFEKMITTANAIQAIRDAVPSFDSEEEFRQALERVRKIYNGYL
ncbi:PIN domain-containing protein [Synechococcus elongatus]|uniref:PIN domain-containing protein n=1 Tax=Synechococcus elongatus TaxID=32046 RepID=UPI0030D52073